ncbi:hypothetical protein KCV06_g541, partial [Aureobasidium melanogenum]
MMLHLGREGKVVSEDGNFLSREDDSCQFSPSPDCSKSPKIQQLHTVVSEYTTRVSLSFSETTDRGTVWYLADLGMAMTERHSECGEPQIIDTSIGTVRFLEEYESSVSRAT